MRRLVLLVAPVLILLLAVASVSAATRPPQLRCGVRHAHVIAATRDAAVVVGEHGEEVDGVYGCAIGHRTYKLGLPEECGEEGCGGISRQVITGTTVAYQWASRRYGLAPEIPNSYSWFVVVRNLRTDRVLRKVPTGAPLAPSPRYTGVGDVESMVVKRDGAVAWIAADFERSPGERLVTPPCEVFPDGRVCPAPGYEPPFIFSYDVYASDRRGTRLLASGTDVAPHSLKLHASTLSWTQGGKPMSAPLT
jgi:hypothetical protein